MLSGPGYLILSRRLLFFQLVKRFQHDLSNLDKYDLIKHAGSFINRDILLLCGLNDNNVILEEHILPLYRNIRALNSNNIKMIVFDTDHYFVNVIEDLTDAISAWIMKNDKEL